VGPGLGNCLVDAVAGSDQWQPYPVQVPLLLVAATGSGKV
jgi:hypothetical protein